MTLQNLNLLGTFLVLMEEGSVTGAARRLGMTQSSVSNALERLRVELGDRLLERQGNRMVPSLRARALEPEIRAALARIDAALEPVSDPGDLAGDFVLGIDEYSLALIGPVLLAVLRARSPGLRLALVSAWPESDAEALFAGRLDLIVGPGAQGLPGLEGASLYDEHFAGLVGPDHPLADGEITQDRWLSYPHLISSQRGIVPATLDVALAERGLTRQVGAAIPIMALAPRFLIGTELVAHVGGRMARILAARQGMVAFDLPIDLPGFRIGLAWHPRNRASGAHRWMREALALAVAQVG